MFNSIILYYAENIIYNPLFVLNTLSEYYSFESNYLKHPFHLLYLWTGSVVLLITTMILNYFVARNCPFSIGSEITYYQFNKYKYTGSFWIALSVLYYFITAIIIIIGYYQLLFNNSTIKDSITNDINKLKEHYKNHHLKYVLYVALRLMFSFICVLIIIYFIFILIGCITIILDDMNLLQIHMFTASLSTYLSIDLTSFNYDNYLNIIGFISIIIFTLCLIIVTVPIGGEYLYNHCKQLTRDNFEKGKKGEGAINILWKCWMLLYPFMVLITMSIGLYLLIYQRFKIIKSKQ